MYINVQLYKTRDSNKINNKMRNTLGHRDSEITFM